MNAFTIETSIRLGLPAASCNAKNLPQQRSRPQIQDTNVYKIGYIRKKIINWINTKRAKQLPDV